MEANPATGFRDFLGGEEAEALKSVRVSVEEERRAGRRFRDSFLANAKRRGYVVSNDERKLAYLRALVDRFARHMRHRERYPRIDVTLIEAPIADGQACPGGTLIFTTALLETADEATVAGVVAHELAHLDLGHIHEYVKRDKLAQTAFQGPASGDFSREFSRFAAAGSVMMAPFKPHHELEADCQAVSWMHAEGYDPEALAEFFEDLHERQRDQPDNPFFQMMRSHPYTLDRRDHVRGRLEQLEAWQPRDLGRFADNLRTLTPRP